ncbi:MAG TPA: cob(I)yrinic acid a,c-diamide adenosyltransferase, partial [Longimicrobiales bacterium]
AAYHHRMKLYTRKGDAGETTLLGGGRVPKSNPRVDAYGAIDELNAVIGWAVSVNDDAVIRERLQSVQPDLLAIGAHLAVAPAPRGRRPTLPALPDERVQVFERWIDEGMAEAPELRAFILPGGAPGAAALHVARTVCRRAERRVVELAEREPIEPGILVYLNRLSDLLFALARVANLRAGVEDVLWTHTEP